MKCPNCNIQLREESYGKILLDRCEKCESIWFDSRELASYRERISNKERPTEYHWEFLERDTLSVLSCPRCESHTLKLGEFHGYRLRHCSECSGFFLSKNTIDEIVCSEKTDSSLAQKMGIEAVGELIIYVLTCLVYGE